MTKFNSLLILFNSFFLCFLILSSYFVTYLTLTEKIKYKSKYKTDTENYRFDETNKFCKNSIFHYSNDNINEFYGNYDSFSNFTNHNKIYSDFEFSNIVYYKNTTKEDGNDNKYENLSNLGYFNNQYLLTTLVQICFAFGLSGLITNKNVLKMGIY